MARKSKTKGGFLMIPFGLINGPAYKSISPASAKGLPFFLAKVKVHIENPARYEIPFVLSHGELKAAIKMSDHPCSDVYKDLIRVGFIDPVEKGGLRGHGKSFSKFKLSRRWERFGTQEFQEINWREFV